MDAAGTTADAFVTAACGCNASAACGCNAPVQLDFCRVFDDFDVASVLLRFLNIDDARKLRATCKLAQQLTLKYRWNDSSLAISSIALWRACFPNARSAKLFGRRYSFPDADFAHLRGVETLRMLGCDNDDGVFEHLGSVRTLEMTSCNDVTNVGLRHLRGIHTLAVANCASLTSLEALGQQIPACRAFCLCAWLLRGLGPGHPQGA